jgi:hypothetical protein
MGGSRVRQRADFHNYVTKQPVDPSATVQRLIAAIGAGTREALWAVQLIERKAAVARWRAGLIAKGNRKLRGDRQQRR